VTPDDVLFTGELVLTRLAPVTAGRELFGYDKHLGIVARTTTTDAKAQFRQVLWVNDVLARFQVDGSSAGQLASAVSLAAAFGLPDASKLPPPAPEFHQLGAMFDVRDPKRVALVDGYAKWRPTMSAWDEETCAFYAGTGSTLGRTLRAVGFEPKVVAHDPAFEIVIDSR
jgi:hypothetical protein